MLIKIPFKPFFKEPMLSGVKVCTARTKRMGEPGDTFEAFGAIFELVTVHQVFLESVSHLWRDEGCRSREHFIEVWNGIHPRSGYSDQQRVWLHRFKMVTA